MKSTQVTTWRRYTKAQKKAYREREMKRRGLRKIWINGHAIWVDRFQLQRGTFNFADRMGSGVPTLKPKGEVL